MIKKYIVLVVGLVLGLCAPMSAMERADGAGAAGAASAAAGVDQAGDDMTIHRIVAAALDERGFVDRKREEAQSAMLRQRLIQWSEEDKRGLLARNATGETPFHVAARTYQPVMIVSLSLLVTKYDILHEALTAQDAAGDTPLHVAIKKGYGLLMTLLISIDDTDVTNKIKNKMGDTPLYCAARCFCDIETVLRGSAGAGAASFDGMVDVKKTDDHGMTLLHYAARDGKNTDVLWLLEHGADVNAVDDEGNTPTHYAAKSGWGFVLLGLLDHGANPTIKNKKGDGPLQNAAIALCLMQKALCGPSSALASQSAVASVERGVAALHIDGAAAADKTSGSRDHCVMQ